METEIEIEIEIGKRDGRVVTGERGPSKPHARRASRELAGRRAPPLVLERPAIDCTTVTPVACGRLD
jgi:hypothetical protein